LVSLPDIQIYDKNEGHIWDAANIDRENSETLQGQVFDLLCNEIIRVDGYLFQQVSFYEAPDTSALPGYDFG